MRRLLVGLLVVVLGSVLPAAVVPAAVPAPTDGAPASASATTPAAAPPSSRASADVPTPPLAPAQPLRIPRFGELPLAFVPNAGQSHAAVRFQAHALRGTTFFVSPAMRSS